MIGFSSAQYIRVFLVGRTTFKEVLLETYHFLISRPLSLVCKRHKVTRNTKEDLLIQAEVQTVQAKG